jgi:hypothetical protein
METVIENMHDLMGGLGLLVEAAGELVLPQRPEARYHVDFKYLVEKIAYTRFSLRDAKTLRIKCGSRKQSTIDN